MSSGSLTVNQNIMVGIDGAGKFYQLGGTLRTAGSFPVECLFLGSGTGGSGNYKLSGGTIEVGALGAGFAGQGLFTMTGGSLTFNYGEFGALSGSSGTMVQSGGTVTQVDKAGRDPGVNLGREAGAQGFYKLSGAASQLNTFFLAAGSRGQGTFLQEGGTVTVRGPLYAGRYATGQGSYALNNGELTAGFVSVGNHGSGEFTQNGGVLTTTGFTYGTDVYPANLWVSRYGDGNGTYNLNGGKIDTGNLLVGGSDPGTGVGIMNFNNAAAQVLVNENFVIGARGQFNAVPGATITMTGSHFDNQSTTPGNLTGLANLTLFFIGGTGSEDFFEVAGKDLGASLAGFATNFALGSLRLGDGTQTAYVGLADAFDNQQDGLLGNEVLYVYDLYVGAGSKLDLHGFHLYCQHFTNFGEILNGSVQVVPLPSSLLLVAAGLASLLAQRGQQRR